MLRMSGGRGDQYLQYGISRREPQKQQINNQAINKLDNCKQNFKKLIHL